VAERRQLIVAAPDAGAELLLDPAAAPRLARSDPQLEIVLVLSDPVEHYLAELAARRARRRPQGATIHMADVAQACRLGTQLRLLHTFFGPERVRVDQRASAGAPAGELWPDLAAALRGLLAPELELLLALAPSVDLARWPAARRLIGDRAMLRPA
jgi:hypothetical protein